MSWFEGRLIHTGSGLLIGREDLYLQQVNEELGVFVLAI